MNRKTPRASANCKGNALLQHQQRKQIKKLGCLVGQIFLGITFAASIHSYKTASSVTENMKLGEKM